MAICLTTGTAKLTTNAAVDVAEPTIKELYRQNLDMKQQSLEMMSTLKAIVGELRSLRRDGEELPTIAHSNSRNLRLMRKAFEEVDKRLEGLNQHQRVLQNEIGAVKAETNLVRTEDERIIRGINDLAIMHTSLRRHVANINSCVASSSFRIV